MEQRCQSKKKGRLLERPFFFERYLLPTYGTFPYPVL